MSNASPSRIGQINEVTGDPLALFLKVFSGEVLTAFVQTVVTAGKHRIRDLDHGKSGQFPAMGRIAAEWHTAGTELLGMPINHGEIVVTIDGKLISHAFLDELDELMNHYDVRGEYSAELGRALAIRYDQFNLREIVKGARASATIAAVTTSGYEVDALPGGTVVQDADLASATAATKAAAIWDAIESAAQALDENEVPDDGQRWCALRPAEYRLLANLMKTNGQSPIHQDYGGSGSISKGTIYELGGINIVKSNQVPNSDTSSSDTKHGVNAGTTVGVVWHTSAIGVVRLLGIVSKVVDMEWKQGTLLLSKMACGHSYLRPEACVELRSATPS